ncbi:hypothetical protein [Portibacter marinus]|uniref:hypothetical protein n=1 Tax=Portibacter marinus TaxID=2898660 RepID=UPI001F432F7B|nr:hypothetical protein [Portibacter marinus]
MSDFSILLRIQIGVILIFILFKIFRSRLLYNFPSDHIQIFLYSFPNFCEAIIGVIFLTVAGLYINRKYQIKEKYIYIMATLLSAIYVITQEYKIHNIGGNNVDDINDIWFSLGGLLAGLSLILTLKPKTRNYTGHSTP